MTVVLMIGDHPRHRYLADRLDDHGSLVGVVVEEREVHVPHPPDHLSDHLADLYERHFQRRSDAEAEFFGDPSLSDVPIRSVPPDRINADEVRTFLRGLDPDITITYGVHILDDTTLDAIPGRAWNVHGGLSPEYRGVITHFWPSYLLEPQMTGVTLHELTAAVDAGPIVHQTGAVLERGDGIHQLASRTVKRFVNELPTVIDLAAAGDLNDPVEQDSTGKLWVSDDWRPAHLRVVYDQFDNDIVDRYLDGELNDREPDLVRQFEH